MTPAGTRYLLVGTLGIMALSGALFLALREFRAPATIGDDRERPVQPLGRPKDRYPIPSPPAPDLPPEAAAAEANWKRFVDAARRDPEGLEGLRSTVSGVADPSLESLYTAALLHENPKVCRIAIENLGKLDTASAAVALLDRLGSERSSELRWHLFMALSYHLDVKQVHSHVRDIAEGPPGPDSTHALWILTSRRSSESDHEFVLRLLEGQSTREKKSELISATASLAKDGSDSACIALVKQFRTLSEPSLRAACFRGLEKAGSLSLLSDSELKEYSRDSTPR
ncbi:MAG: HEAT repeat domain-containing protein [Planctomycetia bacterium]|nr:HEAT repeat domain-containing protein [Planctomycetia bacterium]